MSGVRFLGGWRLWLTMLQFGPGMQQSTSCTILASHSGIQVTIQQHLTMPFLFVCPIAARSDQLPDLHHRVTWHWLGAGSPLRAQLEAFANGVSLAELPVLHVHIAELRFIPTAERVQEADHSIVHRSVGHRKVKGPFVSLSLRLKEIEAVFVKGGPELEYFIEDLNLTIDIDLLVQRLGFHRHPQWVQTVGPQTRQDVKLQILQTVLYGLDVDTQFRCMGGVRKLRAEHARGQQRLIAKWQAQADRPKRRGGDTVLESAMVDHLRARLRPGRIYSMLAGSAGLCGLQQALLPGGLPRAPLPALGDSSILELDVAEADTQPRGSGGMQLAEADAAELAPGPDQVFFKVIHTSPGYAKLVGLLPTAGSRLTRSDICITLHEVSVGTLGHAATLNLCVPLASRPLQYCQRNMQT